MKLTSTKTAKLNAASERAARKAKNKTDAQTRDQKRQERANDAAINKAQKRIKQARRALSLQEKAARRLAAEQRTLAKRMARNPALARWVGPQFQRQIFFGRAEGTQFYTGEQFERQRKRALAAMRTGASVNAFMTQALTQRRLGAGAYGKFLPINPTVELCLVAQREKAITAQDAFLLMSKKSPLILNAVLASAATQAQRRIRQHLKDGKIAPPISSVTTDILLARSKIRTPPQADRDETWHYRGLAQGWRPGRSPLYRPFGIKSAKSSIDPETGEISKTTGPQNLADSIVVVQSTVTPTGAKDQQMFIGIPDGIGHPNSGLSMHRIARLMESGYTIPLTDARRFFFVKLAGALGVRLAKKEKSTRDSLVVPPRPFLHIGADMFTGKDMVGRKHVENVFELRTKETMVEVGFREGSDADGAGRAMKELALTPAKAMKTVGTKLKAGIEVVARWTIDLVTGKVFR